MRQPIATVRLAANATLVALGFWGSAVVPTPTQSVEQIVLRALLEIRFSG